MKYFHSVFHIFKFPREVIGGVRERRNSFASSQKFVFIFSLIFETQTWLTDSSSAREKKIHYNVASLKKSLMTEKNFVCFFLLTHSVFCVRLIFFCFYLSVRHRMRKFKRGENLRAQISHKIIFKIVKLVGRWFIIKLWKIFVNGRRTFWGFF